MTALKLLGGLGLFMACAGAGWCYSRRLYRRVELLKSAELLCEYVSEQVRYANLPFREIWKNASRLESFSAFGVLKSADTADWKSVICKGALLYEREGLLSEDVRIVTEWIEGLGGTDAHGQTEHTKHCAERLARQRERATEQAAKMGRLYAVLGGLGGAAALLLVW